MKRVKAETAAQKSFREVRVSREAFAKMAKHLERLGFEHVSGKTVSDATSNFWSLIYKGLGKGDRRLMANYSGCLMSFTFVPRLFDLSEELRATLRKISPLVGSTDSERRFLNEVIGLSPGLAEGILAFDMSVRIEHRSNSALEALPIIFEDKHHHAGFSNIGIALSYRAFLGFDDGESVGADELLARADHFIHLLDEMLINRDLSSAGRIINIADSSIREVMVSVSHKPERSSLLIPAHEKAVAPFIEERDAAIEEFKKVGIVHEAMALVADA